MQQEMQQEIQQKIQKLTAQNKVQNTVEAVRVKLGNTTERPRFSRQRGFTLLEVMVVVVIIAIMAAAVAPALIGNIEDAQIKRVSQDLKSIETSLNLYKLDNFQYPSTDQGLEALVSKPSGEPAANNWKQRLPKIPIDPWKNPYKYLSPGTHGVFDLYSLGPDGRQSEDDIGNWDQEN